MPRKTNEKKVCFVVDGAWLMGQARSFWAEEDDPERAIKLLKTLHGITDAQVLDILEGRSELSGNSSTGIALSPAKSPPKSPLPSLLDVLNKARLGRLDAEDRAADLQQMLAGETVSVASPDGEMEVPRRKTKNAVNTFGQRNIATLIDGYDWPGVQDPTPGSRTPPIYRKIDRIAWKSPNEDLTESPAEPPEPKRPTLTPDDEITGRLGWLSPEGQFYACAYGAHNWTALCIRQKDENEYDAAKALSEAGWMRLQWDAHEQHFFLDDYDKGPTEAQRALVAKFCAEKKIEIPWLLTVDFAKTK